MVSEAQLDRFRADLDALIESGDRFGVAVSGGPDSLALLLLSAAARPGEIEAATVDHGFREGSRAEAEMVAGVCGSLGVPHSILAIQWDLPPATAVQEQAREVRYGALAGWMRERGLSALATGHHLDDQAETLLMRLARGSGVRGLAGMRPVSTVPGDPGLALIRPLLDWPHSELELICSQSGVVAATDPSNADDRHERVRVRRALAEIQWLDAEALARSASNLATADEALDWAADKEWAEFVDVGDGGVVYRATTAPMEIIRRVVTRAIARLGTEGSPTRVRGRELDRLIADLQLCKTTTLRGVRCSGGLEWKFTRAAPRARP